MADAVQSLAILERRAQARARKRRDDLWLGLSALAAAMAALPLAQSSWHGPEVASTLAVSAVALLAGQRWAIAVVLLAELLLLPTIWPRAFLGGVALWPGRIAALTSLIMIVPGLLSARRAAAAMVLITGWRRTQETCRRVQYAFAALGLVLVALPLL
jgi:uncharacterized membrane protein YjjB (DUF3815 family)